MSAPNEVLTKNKEHMSQAISYLLNPNEVKGLWTLQIHFPPKTPNICPHFTENLWFPSTIWQEKIIWALGVNRKRCQPGGLWLFSVTVCFIKTPCFRHPAPHLCRETTLTFWQNALDIFSICLCFFKWTDCFHQMLPLTEYVQLLTVKSNIKGIKLSSTSWLCVN